MEEILNKLPQKHQQEFEQCISSLQNACQILRDKPDQQTCEQQLAFCEETLHKMTEIWQHALTEE